MPVTVVLRIHMQVPHNDVQSSLSSRQDLYDECLLPNHLLGLQLLPCEQLAGLLHELQPALLRVLCRQPVWVVLDHLPCTAKTKLPLYIL